MGKASLAFQNSPIDYCSDFFAQKRAKEKRFSSFLAIRVFHSGQSSLLKQSEDVNEAKCFYLKVNLDSLMQA